MKPLLIRIPAGLTALVWPCLSAFSTAKAQTATFVGEDRVTKGNWKNVYGREGYNLSHIGASDPSYGTVTSLAQDTWLWNGNTSDVRAPQRITEEYRTAGSWTSFSSATFDLATLTFSDSKVHRVSVYCLGWEYPNRAQTLEIRDAATGALLDSRNVTQYLDGVYYRWNVTGNVKIRVINTAVAPAVSGLFFDVPEPIWWRTGAPPVIEPNAPINNKGPANIGQAKWMAKSAIESLRKVLPVAAAAIEAEVAGAGKPIGNWNPPVTQAEKDLQRAPLLIGQLKAISAPVYAGLQGIAPGWVAGEFARYGVPSDGTYPWTSATTDDNNKSPTLIGQLKAVFSLDFSADRETGPEADGIPDLWEYTVVNVNPADGWTSIGQINQTTAVEAAGDVGMTVSDSDGDGLPDYWEAMNGLDPNDDGTGNAGNGPNGDSDQDGLTNAAELIYATDPQDKDTDDDYVLDGVEVYSN